MIYQQFTYQHHKNTCMQYRIAGKFGGAKFWRIAKFW